MVEGSEVDGLEVDVAIVVTVLTVVDTGFSVEGDSVFSADSCVVELSTTMGMAGENVLSVGNISDKGFGENPGSVMTLAAYHAVGWLFDISALHRVSTGKEGKYTVNQGAGSRRNLNYKSSVSLRDTSDCTRSGLKT